MTRFVLPIEPMPAARPRARRGGHGYYPPRYASWLEAASLLARNAWRAEPVTEPVHLTVVFEAARILVMVRPSDAERGAIKGDLDNLTKSLADALTRGGVLGDDSQVVELSARMDG